MNVIDRECMCISLNARDPNYAATARKTGGEEGHEGMGKEVVAKQVGAEYLTER